MFLVVWEDLRNENDYHVLAVRVSPAGRVLDGTTLTVAGGRGTQALPDVASDGKGFVVVWQGAVEREKSLTYYSLARHVAAAGELGESEQLLEWRNPRIAWGGKQCVAVWERHHRHKKVMFINCDLFASRVRGWRPADRPAVAVATSDLEEKRPASASDREGRLFCAYEGYGADGRVLVKARTLDTR